MVMTTLRKVGGSVMLAVPPALLDVLRLRPGESVGLAIEGGRLVIEPRPRPRYTLAELLAQSDYDSARGDEDPEWTVGPARGQELI